MNRHSCAKNLSPLKRKDHKDRRVHPNIHDHENAPALEHPLPNDRHNVSNMLLPMVVGSIMQGKDRLQKDYRLGEVLGKGGFGVVRVAWSRNRKAVAIKSIDKFSSHFDLKSLEKEIIILKKVDHPHILKLLAVYDEPDRTFLVLELLQGSTMAGRVEAKGLFPEVVAARVVGDCLSALRYLHSVFITHRDIKPENLIFLTDEEDDPFYNHIKLCDMGLASAKSSMSEMMKTSCGTRGYMSPEMLLKQPYTSKVDIWSMGVVVHWMLSGQKPWSNLTTQICYKQVIGPARQAGLLAAMVRGELDLSETAGPAVAVMSPEAKDLIRKMLQPAPDLRFSAFQAMDHNWVRYGGRSSTSVQGHFQAFLQFRESRIFSDLNQDILSVVCNHFQRKSVSPGSKVFGVASSNVGILLVESGKVDLDFGTNPTELIELHEGSIVIMADCLRLEERQAFSHAKDLCTEAEPIDGHLDEFEDRIQVRVSKDALFSTTILWFSRRKLFQIMEQYPRFRACVAAFAFKVIKHETTSLDQPPSAVCSVSRFLPVRRKLCEESSPNLDELVKPLIADPPSTVATCARANRFKAVGWMVVATLRIQRLTIGPVLPPATKPTYSTASIRESLAPVTVSPALKAVALDDRPRSLAHMPLDEEEEMPANRRPSTLMDHFRFEDDTDSKVKALLAQYAGDALTLEDDVDLANLLGVPAQDCGFRGGLIWSTAPLQRSAPEARHPSATVGSSSRRSASRFDPPPDGPAQINVNPTTCRRNRRRASLGAVNEGGALQEQGEDDLSPLTVARRNGRRASWPGKLTLEAAAGASPSPPSHDSPLLVPLPAHKSPHASPLHIAVTTALSGMSPASRQPVKAVRVKAVEAVRAGGCGGSLACCLQ